MIYLNSLLRSSILFDAETMYNVEETEHRQLERNEEEIMRKLHKTRRGCPSQYILTQNKNSLIF